jgi:AraC-like DNA-binding protein
VRIEAGHLAAFWAAIPHQIIEFGTTTEYFVVTIPFAWFLQCKLPDMFVQQLLKGEMHSEPLRDLGRFDHARFAQWEDDLKNPREETNDIVMLELEARLLRLASCVANKAGRSGKDRTRHLALPDGKLNKVEKMACIIAQRYTEQLTINDISEQVGLHPNYAMNLFKKAFGTTLIDYLTHHRVSHAQRLLATTDDKIVDVAFSSGFNSISRFNEAFRRACGCSPREYRFNHETG